MTPIDLFAAGVIFGIYAYSQARKKNKGGR